MVFKKSKYSLTPPVAFIESLKPCLDGATYEAEQGVDFLGTCGSFRQALYNFGQSNNVRTKTRQITEKIVIFQFVGMDGSPLCKTKKLNGHSRRK